MKIQLLSDLHLEMGVNPLLKNFKPVGDVLVLAGDITGSRSKRKLDEVFGHVKIPLVYVLGNHEYYRGSFHGDQTLTEFREWFGHGFPIEKMHLLENQHVDIDGVRFIGATYWSNPSPLEELEIKRCIADFHVIEGCRVQEIRDKRVISKDYIRWAASEARAKGLKTVVVTHFPPSWQAREERFKTSALGSYFYNDDEKFVELISPDLWIYGHTHGNLRFKVGDVPVVCNQMGYTKGSFDRMACEPCYKDFDLNYVIEI